MLTVTLILTVVLMSGEPKQQAFPMPSVEACVHAVEDFMGIDMKVKGFKAIGATCVAEDTSEGVSLSK